MPPPRHSYLPQSPASSLDGVADDVVSQLRQIVVGHGNGSAAVALEFNGGWSWLDLDQPVTFRYLDRMASGEADPLTNIFGYNNPAGRIDGSSHGRILP